MPVWESGPEDLRGVKVHGFRVDNEPGHQGLGFRVRKQARVQGLGWDLCEDILQACFQKGGIFKRLP